TAGYFGNGIAISGNTSAWVQAPMSESLATITSAFTLEAWVKLTDLSQTQTVLSFGSATQILYLNYGVPRLRARLNGTQYEVWAPASIVVNQWTHVAGTYDGTQLRLYVNGVQVATA